MVKTMRFLRYLQVVLIFFVIYLPCMAYTAAGDDGLGLDVDISLDTSFNPPDPNGEVYSIVLQEDGKILMGSQGI
jgi:hypothetical protein